MKKNNSIPKVNTALCSGIFAARRLRTIEAN
jgi:hypothetical protein